MREVSKTAFGSCDVVVFEVGMLLQEESQDCILVCLIVNRMYC